MRLKIVCGILLIVLIVGMLSLCFAARALPNVHLESKQDQIDSMSNIGTITFDSVSYSLPSDFSKASGIYQATYYPVPGYAFDHWETGGDVSVSLPYFNPAYSVNVSGSGFLRAIYRPEPAPPYWVALQAYCITQGMPVSVPITMDGTPTGRTTPEDYTPLMFYDLTGTHSFTVPDNDGSGHPFLQWNTGETSTTITVSWIRGPIAYYRGSVSVFDATIVAHCNTEGADIGVGITMDGSSTGYNTPLTRLLVLQVLIHSQFLTRIQAVIHSSSGALVRQA